MKIKDTDLFKTRMSEVTTIKNKNGFTKNNKSTRFKKLFNTHVIAERKIAYKKA